MAFRTLSPIGTQKPQGESLFRNLSNQSSNQEKTPNPYGATFRSSPGDNPLEAGLKAAGNIPSSAFNLGKSVVTAIANPIDTIKGVGSTIAGGVQKLIPGKQNQEQSFDQFTGFLKERYGSLENLQKTATEDPVGFGSDIVGLFTGGAALAGRGAEAANIISKTAQTITKPIGTLASKTAGITAGSAKYGVSQLTGLNPETITELVKDPKAFKNVSPEIRVETAQKVGDALDSRIEELSDLGKEYEAIRATTGKVVVPEGSINKVLDKYGVKLDNDGKILTTSESRPLSTTDRTALQDFITNYGLSSELTPNSLLNTREALSNLSKFEQGKTSLPQLIARDLRSVYDEAGKTQVPGLKELDAKYAPERQLLGQLKKDIFDAKGELKDGAISKIANVTGRGKEQLLERIKQVVPDIEQRVRVMKAVEGIEAASSLKVGTYARAGVGITGLVTGNIPAIIAAILAQPEVAVPLLKGAGYVGNKAIPVLQALRNAAENINGFRFPAPVLIGLPKEEIYQTVE